MLNVVFKVLCPTKFCVTLIFIPLSAQRVMYVCRKSCSLWVGQYFLKICVNVSGLKLNIKLVFALFRSSSIISANLSVKGIKRSLVAVLVPFILMRLSFSKTSLNKTIILIKTPTNGCLNFQTAVCFMVAPTRIELVISPWEGDVLTSWPWSHIVVH